MKYTNQTIEQLDSEIEKMLSLDMPNSAFKRVIPAHVKEELRNQYIDYLTEQKVNTADSTNDDDSRPVSTKVIRVNITSLREAGYCVCPNELATACETLIRQQAQANSSEVSNDMNTLTENIRTGKTQFSETAESDSNCDHDTTNPKSEDAHTDDMEVEKTDKGKVKKAYPAKLDSIEFSKKTNSKKAHQGRTTKRKYFTKYMSNEFSKDTKPVSMAEMDAKTQQMFRDREFNDLVSEITGMN